MTNNLESTTRQIIRYLSGSQASDQDNLAVEEPLEIRVRSRSISVTMRTPGPRGNDAELAVGFLLTEGMIHHSGDVLQTEIGGKRELGNVINVFLDPDVTIDFDQMTRHVFASSSCGLCGKATIDAVHHQFDPIDINSHPGPAVPPDIILALPSRLRTRQQTFDRTGGLHAAGIFDLEGNLIVLREDVGRHNAVDKVIGYGLLHDLLPFDHHILMVSGRASFEITQKALAARLAIIAAVSAPSSLAVDFANQSNQTLIGFLRNNRMNIYTHPHRLGFNTEHDVPH